MITFKGKRPRIKLVTSCCPFQKDGLKHNSSVIIQLDSGSGEAQDIKPVNYGLLSDQQLVAKPQNNWPQFPRYLNLKTLGCQKIYFSLKGPSPSTEGF